MADRIVIMKDGFQANKSYLQEVQHSNNAFRSWSIGSPAMNFLM